LKGIWGWAPGLAAVFEALRGWIANLFVMHFGEDAGSYVMMSVALVFNTNAMQEGRGETI
jgi:hypothetical protein